MSSVMASDDRLKTPEILAEPSAVADYHQSRFWYMLRNIVCGLYTLEIHAANFYST